MSRGPEKVIYDCNIHVQYLLNPRGAGGECVTAAMSGLTELIISYYILDELREMPDRPLLRKAGLTSEMVEIYVANVVPKCTLVAHCPHLFEHPIDRGDSHYVDLAIATDAKIIVSRDRHLLGLVDPTKSWGADFRQRFGSITIMTGEAFAAYLRNQGARDV